MKLRRLTSTFKENGFPQQVILLIKKPLLIDLKLPHRSTEARHCIFLDQFNTLDI
jgi:hypothetical protein